MWEYLLLASATAGFALLAGSALATGLLLWRLDMSPARLYWTGLLTALGVSALSLGLGAQVLLAQMRLNPRPAVAQRRMSEPAPLRSHLSRAVGPPRYNEGMPSRVLAFLLAVVLLWSGLNTIEAPHSFAWPSHEQRLAIVHAGGQAAAHEGSVEHHHLDDLPSQAQGDPPPETPGLLPAPLAPSAQRMVMAQPHPFATAEAGPPFLAGPLRPPCSAALAG